MSARTSGATLTGMGPAERLAFTSTPCYRHCAIDVACGSGTVNAGIQGEARQGSKGPPAALCATSDLAQDSQASSAIRPVIPSRRYERSARRPQPCTGGSASRPRRPRAASGTRPVQAGRPAICRAPAGAEIDSVAGSSAMKASSTSRPTSKASGPIPGPTQARQPPASDALPAWPPGCAPAPRRTARASRHGPRPTRGRRRRRSPPAGNRPPSRPAPGPAAP